MSLPWAFLTSVGTPDIAGCPGPQRTYMAVEQAAFVGGEAFAFLESLNRHFKLRRCVQRQDKTKEVVGVGWGEKEIRWLAAGSSYQSQP